VRFWVLAPLTLVLALTLLNTDPRVQAAPPENAVQEDLLEAGHEAYRRGDFREAALRWSDAAQAFAQAGRVREQTDALLALAQAQQSLGLYREAIRDLNKALAAAEQGADAVRLAEVLGSAGSLYAALGDLEKADEYLPRALQLARDEKNQVLIANLLNNVGRVRYSQGKIEEALQAYNESLSIALATKNEEGLLRARINLATLLSEAGRFDDANREANEAAGQLRLLPDSYDVAFGWISIGLIVQKLRGNQPHSKDALTLDALRAFKQASEVALRLQNPRVASYAWGHIGSLYEEERRYDEALEFTDRAILSAQDAVAPEALHRWYWQRGRLLTARKQPDEAIVAYRRAVAAMESIRPELAPTSTEKSFRDGSGRLYFELADLLLRQAALQPSSQKEKPFLTEARDVIEKFKGAELRDYFRDECVDAAQSRAGDVEKASKNTAVLYPILLADRTELLVSVHGQLTRVTVPATAATLRKEVGVFRHRLEKRTTEQYRPHAQQLYDWLIRPIVPLLEAQPIDTLVVVPDGLLRTIPFSALHDGKQFLIERYAIATVPGLSLTDAHPFKRERARALSAGLSQEVQSYPSLPNVVEELRTVQRLYPGTLLANHDFVLSRLERELRQQDFTILHIASHGEFNRDARKSFILTFDDKLTMDKLEEFVGLLKFRETPLALLTLSACQTAAEDDRAALGLAGVAIKAGAASALATLWSINDEAASILVSDFYRELYESSATKAVALQRAQLKLMQDSIYHHPAYWSPFLLLSNWL
jgi:CHAT domain-containing protein